MNYTDEDLALMYDISVKKPYSKHYAPRAVFIHDARIFHFCSTGAVGAVSILHKTDKEIERRLPDFIYDIHVTHADTFQLIQQESSPKPGYKEAISAMRKLGLSEKVASRMLSDHGIHPPKVAINLWSLHKFTSLGEWIKMNLEKRSEIK